MKRFILISAIFGTITAQASTNVIKDIDQINATGGSTLNVPATGGNLVSDTGSVTLTNKTISGSSNTLSSIPVSAISTGTGLSVQSGGTGNSSLTLNGLLFGNGTSSAGVTAAGSQFQIYQAGASGVPTVGALNLGQAAATTGQLPVGAGGTGSSTLTSGSVVVGNGTSAVSLVAPGTSGNVLTSNGSTWTSAASVSGGAPNISGSYASPTAVTAVGGVTISGLISNGPNFAFISGSGGPVTVTATPSVAGCSSAATAGTIATIVGGTNAVTLQDSASLASSGLSLNGNWTSASGRVLTLFCASATGPWIELSRSN